MKATGIVRKTDTLGRFVIPKELRKTFGFDSSQELEVYTDGNSIIIKKFQRACVICGKVTDLCAFSDILMCESCIAQVSEYREGSERKPLRSIAL